MIGTTIGVFYGLLLGTYVRIELGSSECSNDGNKDDKNNCLLLRFLLESIDTLELGINEGDKIGSPSE